MDSRLAPRYVMVETDNYRLYYSLATLIIKQAESSEKNVTNTMEIMARGDKVKQLALFHKRIGSGNLKSLEEAAC